MSKEGELKLIDLRVSVHCCDGCKKKVKKALQAIEGVVRTEIHSSQSRVTVEVRMVESRTLIKKLAKIGKPAELWNTGGGAAQPKDEKPKESSKGGNNDTKENSKSKDGKCKPADENGKSSSKSEERDKSKKNENSGNGGADKGGKKGEKDANGGAASSNNALPEVTKTVNPFSEEDCTIKPGIVHLGNTGAYSPYSYTIAPPPPPAGPQVCYMITSYSAPPVYFARSSLL